MSREDGGNRRPEEDKEDRGKEEGRGDKQEVWGCRERERRQNKKGAGMETMNESSEKGVEGERGRQK